MALAVDGRAPRVDIAEVSTAGAGELRLSGRPEIFVLLFFETPNILGFLWVDFHGSVLAKPGSFLRIFLFLARHLFFFARMFFFGWMDFLPIFWQEIYKPSFMGQKEGISLGDIVRV